MDRGTWWATVHGAAKSQTQPSNFPSGTPSWITALLWQRGFCNSMKLWARPLRATQDGLVTVEGSDKMWSTRGGNSSPLQHSCHGNTVTAWKGKKIRHWNMSPPGPKVSNMLLGKSRGQLLIAPERMKQLGQSGTDAQLWMCLVVKVKPNAVKNSIAWEPWIKEIGHSQTGDGKSEYRQFRNQWTKMDRDGRI